MSCSGILSGGSIGVFFGLVNCVYRLWVAALLD